LDRCVLVGPLQLRNWHPGDEFVAPGRSRQKIKTLFQEARVPIWDRHGWPVLTCGGEIVWTRQFGTAEPFLPRVQSGSVLRVYEVES
jgi:tRNA(Ile)-lysidine synthetase-like protein